MDIQLPDIDGVEALGRLRADERTAAIPVLALTAQAMQGDRERFLAAGFDGYVSKPVDIVGARRHRPAALRGGGSMSGDATATILVVDDVPENVRLLEAVLVSRGYDVVSATDGDTALELAVSAKPDLVLLDVQMPPPDGYEVCRRLREHEETAVLPVIMLTASLGSEKTTGIEAGADDFIAKPFNHDELFARVRSLLRIKRYHDTIKELNRTLEERVRTQVEELERLRRLQRFLSPQLADAIVSSGDDSILSSHRRLVTMFFADLRGWTSFVDAVEPEELMRVLGEFHETIGRLVRQFDATVGFIEGDGVQLFFNDPIEIPDAPLRAVQLGCALRQEMAELTPLWRKRGLRPRLRRRHRARPCDLRRGRLRGPLRLRRDRRGHEPRLAARGRSDRRAGPDRAAALRGGRVRGRGRAGRRGDAQGLPAPRRSVQRRCPARGGGGLGRSRRVDGLEGRPTISAVEVVDLADAVEFLERAAAAAARRRGAAQPDPRASRGRCATTRTSTASTGCGSSSTEARWSAPRCERRRYNLVLARPRFDEALEALASAIGGPLPGVTAALPEADAFADAWEAKTGVRPRLRVSQRIYALEQVKPVEDVPGAARPATDADRPLLRPGSATSAARRSERRARTRSARSAMLDHRLGTDSAGFAIWEDGLPVSLAGFGGETPNGVRIGPVYTPPVLRGRGYGSAVTAAVTADRLAAGRRFCFLYTDATNPTSNKIYPQIGYEPVCDAVEYAFE